jgi:uncharacterized protein (DUF58 family)
MMQAPRRRIEQASGKKQEPGEKMRSTGEQMDRRWYYLSLALLIAGIAFLQALLIVSGLLLLLVLALTDLWAHYCLQELSYQRALSQRRVVFGEEITLTLTIENAKLLPLPWIELEDRVPYGLEISGHELGHAGLRREAKMLEVLFSVRWYERVTRRYSISCTRRGVHTFGPSMLRSGDIFGFVNREIHLPNYQHLLVYPLVVPITSFGLPARHPFGDLRAPRRLLEDPARVIGVRDYMYGDSLQRVNWKATARTMQLQSKVYEATTTYTLTIFLNVHTTFDSYFGIHPELQELAICAAASISQWAIDQDFAVGLYANTIMSIPDDEQSRRDTEVESQETRIHRRRVHLPAAGSPEQFTRIMDVLARLQTYFGTNIEDVLLAEHTRLPAGATVVMITSALSEPLVDALSRTRQAGHAVAILFIGDTPPPISLGGITVYHLGGEQTWTRLTASYRADDVPTLEGLSSFSL